MCKEYRNVYYRAGWDGKFVDNIISIGTWINEPRTKGYSHAEVWLPDNEGRFVTSLRQIYSEEHPDLYTGMSVMMGELFDQPIFLGTCYTSTLGQVRDKNSKEQSGTLSRPARDVFRHPERWDFSQHGISDDKYYAGLTLLRKLVENNQGYSKKDLLRFIMPIAVHKALGFYDKDLQICSEIVKMYNIEVGVLTGEPLVSPRRLSRQDLETGVKIKSLV